MKKTIILFILTVAVSSAVYSDVSRAAYLLTGLSPRQAALGSAAAAASDSAPALNINPACASLVTAMEVSASQALMPLGISGRMLTGAISFDFGVIAAQYQGYNFGSIEALEADQFGRPVITGDVLELSSDVFTIAYAKKTGNLGIGAAIKGVFEKMGKESSFGAADIGITYSEILNGTMGISINNIGKNEEGALLPLAARGAFSWKIKDNEKEFIDLMAGVYYLKNENYIEGQLGMEFKPFEMISLRAGASINGNAEMNFSAGLGIKYNDMSLDYSYSPGAVPGDTHRIGINAVSFGADDKKEEGGETKAIREPAQNFTEYLKSGDYYFRAKKYSQAVKFYERINVLYWKDLDSMKDNEKSSFYQRVGLCYYNLRDNRNSAQYFEKALFFSPDNEVLKYWLKLVKQ